VERAWSTGAQAPLGAKGAKKLAGEDFTIACEQTGAVAAQAERWSEPGFAGEWLVFRLLSKGAGMEIGLPILSGRQSEALFWIPTTLRGPGSAGRASGRSGPTASGSPQAVQPARAGEPPGARRLPRRARSASEPDRMGLITTLRSANGFPIQIVDASGKSMGRAPSRGSGRPAAAEPEAAGWILASKRGSRKAVTVYRREHGARLFVGPDGNAIQIEPDARGAPGQHWLRFLDSAAPLRAGPAKVADDDRR
jgi:hypothetical protein